MSWDIGKLNKGKHLSKKTKDKISKKLTGRSVWNNGLELSNEHKLKISTTRKRKKIKPTYVFPDGHTPWNKNKTQSEVTKQKISIAKRGSIPWNKNKNISDETKLKISKSKKGKTIVWNIGKPRTPEEKAKMRAAAIKMWKRRRQSKIN